MLLKFGVNAKAIPTVPRVAVEDINEYFTTCESDGRQQSIVRKTLERLGMVGSRNYVIAFDETYWSPTYDLLPAGPNKNGILIGGPWGHGKEASTQSEKSRPSKQTPPNLNLSRLSSVEGKNVDHGAASGMSLSFCIARADTSPPPGVGFEPHLTLAHLRGPKGCHVIVGMILRCFKTMVFQNKVAPKNQL